MSRSKSLMTSSQNTSKSVINPVSTSSQQELQFSAPIIQALNVIESNYVEKMARRKYLEIPDSMFDYISLNDTMLAAIAKQKNTNIRLLFQIATDGMAGALHSKTLSADNTDLNFQVLLLNTKVDNILSGINEVKAIGENSGEFVITKTFKLSPLYSYYIYLYGMPAYGVGFDVTKLSLLRTIMTKYGISLTG